MNYYNPYMTMTPFMMNQPVRAGLFSRLFGGKGITFSSILSGTQKAIGFANQAIPIVKQVGPTIQNAKTMFHVMNEFKKVDTPTVTDAKIEKEEKKEETISSISNNDGPTFFL